MKASGFTFVYNALRVGIPIRESILAVRPFVKEMVVADAGSKDGTRQLLEQMIEVDRVIDTEWGTDAGETLKRLHALNSECSEETIIHFEADEVWEDRLLEHISGIRRKYHSYCVYRIQVEQNFQRIRWYPELVHRVFRRGKATKAGHTTEQHTGAEIIPPEHGLLWDVTNCFRDNYLARVDQQAELWGGVCNYKMVPLHYTQQIEYERHEIEENLKLPHWEFKESPLKIPDLLLPLVGKTKYE